MKNIIYISFLLIGYLSSGQNGILNDSILKPGIYLTIEQIVNNRPIPAPNLIFEKDTVHTMINWKNKDINIYHLKISWQQAEQTQKQGGILGFCDGKDIYLSSTFNRSDRNRSFYKVEKICHFLYYEGIDVIYINSRHAPFDHTRPYSQCIVDLSKKELNFNVNNSDFKKIISDKPKLLDGFKSEDNKSTVYKEYLQKYCYN
tara:strand:+ start:316 stop:921 length:606 start_codon:yes stop_codon:yes gene_type:complete